MKGSIEKINEINALLSQQLGFAYRRARWRLSGVGCINETWMVDGDGLAPLFVKLGAVDAEDMYRQEQTGLTLLSRVTTWRVPYVYGVMCGESFAALVMSFIELCSVPRQSEVILGESLAALHEITSPQHGLREDNYIGLTRQINGFSGDWWFFFCERRLAVQLSFARDQGLRGPLIDQIQCLIDAIPSYFAHHQPAPSLLHGDLWSGNVAADRSGVPVVYDPAVYYGDAETDIAMRCRPCRIWLFFS